MIAPFCRKWREGWTIDWSGAQSRWAFGPSGWKCSVPWCWAQLVAHHSPNPAGGGEGEIGMRKRGLQRIYGFPLHVFVRYFSCMFRSFFKHELFKINKIMFLSHFFHFLNFKLYIKLHWMSNNIKTEISQNRKTYVFAFFNSETWDMISLTNCKTIQNEKSCRPPNWSTGSLLVLQTTFCALAFHSM